MYSKVCKFLRLREDDDNGTEDFMFGLEHLSPSLKFLDFLGCYSNQTDFHNPDRDCSIFFRYQRVEM
jgi:hypothetical protein